MGLFSSKEEKEAKKDQKIQELLKIYKVDNLKNEEDLENVKGIVSTLSNASLMQLGNFLAGSTTDVAKENAILTKAITEQNFIIIKQLDRIGEYLKNK